MPIQYLLPCSCGRKTPVETRQAGEVIVCACGANLEIPRLLELKKLEKVATQTATAKKPANWGVGHSLIVAGVVLLAIAIFLGIFVQRQNAGNLMTPEQIRGQFEKMTPAATWDTWVILQQMGLNPQKDRLERYFEGEREKNQMILVFLGIAAAGGAALVVGGIVIVRRSRSPSASRQLSS